MPTLAKPAAEEFVDRLLNTEHADQRRALIEAHWLEAAELHTAILHLIDGAGRLMGADAVRMEHLCRDALSLAEAGGDAYLQAMARMRLGDSLRAQGRNIEALAEFDAARAVFLTLERPMEAARTRVGWVSCAAKLGRVPEALAAAAAARRIFKAQGAMEQVASLDMSVGLLQVQAGAWPEALLAFSRALRFFAASGRVGGQTVTGESHRIIAARMHQNRGAALGQLGRHREALSELAKARPVFEELGEAGGLARLTSNIGINHLALGHYAAALRTFEASLDMSRSLGIGRRELGFILPHLADCYLALNRPADALRVLQDAADDLRSVEDAKDALAVATRQVVAHLYLGQRAEALALMDLVAAGSLEVGKNHRAWLAVQRSRILLADGKPAEALISARSAETEARAIAARRLIADALLVQGLVQAAQGRTSEARRAAQRARRLAAAIDAAPLLQRSHELLGVVAEAAGKSQLARHHYGEAIRQLEREQQGVIFEFRHTFAAGRTTAYERLAALQVHAGRSAEAWMTAERAKSRALVDAIRGNVEPRPRGNAVTRRLARDLMRAREDYAAACSRLASENGSVGEPGDSGTNDQAHLAALEARIADLVQRLQIAGADDGWSDLYAPALESELPALTAGTALLEFFYSGNDLLRFFVADGTIRAEILSGAVPEVERLVRAVRMNLEAAQQSGPECLGGLQLQALGILGRLYGTLLGGLEGLQHLRSIVIVPHGLLHYLPFHALHDGEHFLVERTAVSYAPSAALYNFGQPRRPRRGGALVMGHSAGGRLPDAAAEAAAVSDTLGVAAHCEDAATRSLLEREGRRAALIHIAAHGEFRPDAPLFSRIELADGPLTTADVFELDLGAALVVLSACDTGRAVLGGGDELSGLAQAFLYAGAPRLLVSQWRVEDAATAELMTAFYRELVAGAGAASALRAAQCALIASATPENGRGHPLFWAAFQVIGGDHSLNLLPVRGPRRNTHDRTHHPLQSRRGSTASGTEGRRRGGRAR